MQKAKYKKSHIGILGLGLIGGSIAKDLHAYGHHIVGIDKNKKTINLAIKKGIIKEGYTDLSNKSLAKLDIVFICVPLNQMSSCLKILSSFRKREIIVTDVSSTKTKICKIASTILPENITFIGGHPMAGIEKHGFEASQKSLFKGKAWIFCNPNNKDKKTKNAIKLLELIVQKLGAKPFYASPEEHDLAVAYISHLPILLSLSLCNLLIKLKNKNISDLASKIASSGFRDTTRIAGCDPNLSYDLLLTNKENVKTILINYIEEVKRLLILISKGNKLPNDMKNISLWRTKLFDLSGNNSLLTKAKSCLR